MFYLLYEAVLNHGHVIGSLTRANRPWSWSSGTPKLSVWKNCKLNFTHIKIQIKTKSLVCALDVLEF